MNMDKNTILVTGSSGLIGSEVVTYFDHLGWEVHGIDNNMRADFFGPDGDKRWNQRRLEATCRSFRHHELDTRDRQGILACIEQLHPDLVVHTAAQPSHDLAARRAFDDFDVNAVGTLNLLEAVRLVCYEGGRMRLCVENLLAARGCFVLCNIHYMEDYRHE